MKQPIKTALLSFGMSGRVFHAPFIELHKGFELAGSWERSNRSIQKAYPATKSYESLEAVLADDSVALVVVNTPIFSHFEYAKKALLAGKHLIVEKAFTTTVAEAEELKTLALRQNLKISVFQNRRWDSDFRTVRKMVTEGWLGEICEAEFHFDRFNLALSPKLHKEIPGPGAGILKDLGPHLIDQALFLFGMPEALFADIRITRPASQVDDYIDLLLYYPKLRVRLKSGYIVREPVPSFVVHGDKGSFLKTRADVQEGNLIKGIKPNRVDWGAEPDSEQGMLHAEIDGKVVREKVQTLRGNYYEYYDGVFRAFTEGLPMPVTVDDGINVMRIIEAAIESSRDRRVVAITS